MTKTLYEQISLSFSTKVTRPVFKHSMSDLVRISLSLRLISLRLNRQQEQSNGRNLTVEFFLPLAIFIALENYRYHSWNTW